MELSLQIWTRHSLSKGFYVGVKRRSHITSVGECKQKTSKNGPKMSKTQHFAPKKLLP